MLKTVLGAGAALGLLLNASPVSAQDEDCIENVAGKTVCGAAADAVRARMRAEARYAQNPGAARPQTGSAYRNFGAAAFVRGGYAFAGLNPGDNIPADAPLVGGGFRIPVARNGQNLISFETEAVYIGSSEEFEILDASFDAKGWALAGLFGLRWQYLTSQGISPFLSAGIGPGYIKGRVTVDLNDGEPPFTESESVLALAYSGRAGLAVNLTDSVSVEWAYRYLGATKDATIGAHAAEMGLNVNF